jgi:VWFA-related protein
MVRALAAAGFLLALPAMASQRVTVVQLEHMLQQEQPSHKSDSAMAQELSEVVLTEQLTASTLQRITSEVQLGPQTTQALDLLADASALLAPPAGEILPDPRPDMAQQRAMFTAAIDYVVNTLHHLPDFLAMRETRSFNDIPRLIGHSGYAPVTPMHLAGTFHRDIAYRGGKEVIEREQTVALSNNESGPAGLTTWGEFGPVLGTILGDSLKGRVTWSRWEQGRSGRIAVFHYQVPATASHYLVDFCCAWQDLNRSGLAIGQTPAGNDDKPLRYHGTPAYHGELYLDPKTGAVVRVTVEAQLGSEEAIRQAAISVQYGSVEIGGKDYICPIRSVAVSQTMDRPGKLVGGTPPVTRLNETTFIGYHRFGSSSRILAEAPPNLPATGGVPAEVNPSSTVVNTPSPAPLTSATPSTEEPPIAGSASSATRVETTANASTAGNHLAVQSSSESVQPKPEPVAESNAPTTPVLKTTTREVVVDVVITKNNGEPVTGLTKQDFVVSENGQSQNIDFFEEHSPGEQATSVSVEMPPLPTGAVTNVPPAATGNVVNVLLLDSLNTPPPEQANVQRQVLNFVRKVKPGTRIAVFTLGAKLHFVQGFTTDSSMLLASLKAGGLGGEKNGLSRSDAADDASDIANLQMIQASPIAIDAYQRAQSEARSADAGAHAAMTFEALTYLAHYLSGVPGRKNLLWFSSSFPVVIFPSEDQSKPIENQPALRGSLQRIKQTADLFTASQISVYPIGAEGLMNEHVMEADVAGPASPEGSGHAGAMAGDTMQSYNAEAGRRAQVADAMQQLAASTGGKAFYNTNDLNATMQKAINDGGHYYAVGYSPSDTKMDGSFRRIDLSVTHGKYRLAYRHGYNAEERPPIDPKTQVNPLADLLDYGLPGATGILYGVDTQMKDTEDSSAATRAGDNPALQGPLTRYRVDFTIRTNDVEWNQDAQGVRSGRLLIGLKAYDRDGHAVNWEARDESVQVNENEYSAALKSGVSVHLAIDLPTNGEEHLVTAVYDWNSGRAGTLELRLGAKNAK